MDRRSRMSLKRSSAILMVFLGTMVLTTEAGNSHSPAPEFVWDQYLSIDFDESAPAPAPEPTAKPSQLSASTKSYLQPVKWLTSLLGAAKGGRASLSANRAPRTPTTRPVRRSAVATVDYKSTPSTGTSSGSRVVSATIGCSFSIEDSYGDNWDWTYEARIFDPNNTEIDYKTNWASQKPAFSSSLSTPLNDPVVGTYRCTIDWWVYNTYLGSPYYDQTLSYPVPSGESTASTGWAGTWPTMHKWEQTLQSGTFKGRIVWEQSVNENYLNDTCYWGLSEMDPWFYVTSGPDEPWDVRTSNVWGPDVVGWHPDSGGWTTDWKGPQLAMAA